MPEYADAVGFGKEEDFLNVISLSIDQGNITFRNNYCYHKLEINDGIEILTITRSATFITTKPYFKSKSPIPVTLLDSIPKELSDTGKRLTAYSIPDEYPIPFDYSYEEEIPEEIDTEKEYKLNLTAFAHSLKIYKDIDEITKKIPLRSNRFKSIGITDMTIAPDFYMQPSGDRPALLGGQVIDTKIITNSLTRQQVRWLKIDNVLGNLEIVYPEKELKGELQEGYYIQGEFWLIGYIESFHDLKNGQGNSDDRNEQKDVNSGFDVAYM